MKSIQTQRQFFFRVYATACLAIFCLVCITGCADFQFVWQEQPSFIKPERAPVETMATRELTPLNPEIRRKLLKNIAAWRLELKQWNATADLYNAEVNRRNEETRRLLKVP